MPGDRATRGRAVREGREQGRGRPGRAAGDSAGRADGGRQQLLPVSGQKNVSTSRLRGPNAPSRSHENTQLPLPGLGGSPAPFARAPAHPRTQPPGPPTGAHSPGEPYVMKMRRLDWPHEASSPPSPPGLSARARGPLPFAPAPSIGAGAHAASPRPAHTAPPRPRFPTPPRPPQAPTATWGSAEIWRSTTPGPLTPEPRSPGLSSGGRRPRWRSGSP